MDKKVNIEELKQQIENREFENLFSLLESEELIIYYNYYNAEEKIEIRLKDSKNEEIYQPIKITLDTLIEILKQKNVVSYMSGNNGISLFKNIFKKYITKDLIKTFIDIEKSDSLKQNWVFAKELLEIIPEEYQEFAKECLIKYAPPIVTGESYGGKRYTGYLIGQRYSTMTEEIGSYLIVSEGAFGDDGMLHLSEYPYDFIKKDTIVLVETPATRDFIYLSQGGKYAYIDSEGNEKSYKFILEMQSLNKVLSLNSILKQNFEKNPKEIILKVIKKLKGKIVLNDSNKKCDLLSEDETCIGIFDYDTLFELIKEGSILIKHIINPSKEFMRKIAEMKKEPENSSTIDDFMIEFSKKEIANQDSTLSEELSRFISSQWLEVTEKLTEIAPPLIEVKIDENLCQGYLFSSNIDGKIFFVEEKGFVGNRLDINYIHEYNPQNQTIQYLPSKKNNILCMVDKYSFTPQTGYFNSKKPNEYYCTSYFDGQFINQKFGHLSLLTLEEVKGLVEKHNMIVEDYEEKTPIIAVDPPKDNHILKRRILASLAGILATLVIGSAARKQKWPNNSETPTTPTTSTTDTNPTTPTDEQEYIKPTIPIEDNELPKPITPGEELEPTLPEEDNTELEESSQIYKLYDTVCITDNIYSDMYSMVEGENSKPAKFDESTEYSIIGMVIAKDKTVKIVDIFTPDYDKVIEANIENGYKVEGYVITIFPPNQIQSRDGTTVSGFIPASSVSRTNSPERTR